MPTNVPCWQYCKVICSMFISALCISHWFNLKKNVERWRYDWLNHIQKETIRKHVALCTGGWGMGGGILIEGTKWRKSFRDCFTNCLKMELLYSISKCLFVSFFSILHQEIDTFSNIVRGWMWIKLQNVFIIIYKFVTYWAMSK